MRRAAGSMPDHAKGSKPAEDAEDAEARASRREFEHAFARIFPARISRPAKPGRASRRTRTKRQ